MRSAVATVIAMQCLVAEARAQTTAADNAAHPVVSTALAYTGQLVGNARGGARRGTAYTGSAAAQFTIHLERLVGWRNARIFVFALNTHGGAPSDLVGDVQGVDNLQATPKLRLEELWFQQNLIANRLSVLVGRYDLNSEFYRVQSGGLFLNSSFGIGAEFAQSGVEGPSIFPNTAVGARVDFKPSPNTVGRIAVLDGTPVDRGGGGVRLFARGDGALFVSEMAVLSRPDTSGEPRTMRFLIGRGTTRPYRGKIAIGAWSYTTRFSDLSDTLVGGAPVVHRGSRGAYVIADQTVWSARSGPRALTAFMQVGIGDARVNQTGRYVGAGVTLAAPMASRAQDVLGLAFANARNGSHFVRARSPAHVPLAGESAVELTYVAQFGTALTVQPDVQLVVKPGGTFALRNAIVPGIRIAVSREE